MAKVEHMEVAMMHRVDHEGGQVDLLVVLKLGHQQKFEKSCVPVVAGDQRLVSQMVQKCLNGFKQQRSLHDG